MDDICSILILLLNGWVDNATYAYGAKSVVLLGREVES